MKEDKIMEMFFDPKRWEKAISKGIDKDMSKACMYRLCKEETRCSIYEAMRDGRYRICPPHTAKIPKDNGDFRTVYVNESIDRIVLSIINDLLFEIMPEMVHRSCKSYQKGIGCGRIVRLISEEIRLDKGAWKSDLSKYFDSVPVRYIDAAFDRVEEKWGKSKVIDVVREYYHSDVYFDEHGEVNESYQSLKQGCAVAAWLADVILYHIDEKLSSLGGVYVRYSDDMLFVGERYMDAMEILERELALMDMKLNPKKVEYLSRDRWFKFLGFSIKGNDVSLSPSGIKKFQKSIEDVTVRAEGKSLKKAVSDVNRVLYKGNFGFSWATRVLPVINVKKDVDTLNSFVMDALRAVQTNRRKIGGLGFVKTQDAGCISRGKGRNVSSNRKKTQKTIQGYMTIGCMQNALRTCREAYDIMVATMQ